ncbi:MAG TPA: sigma-54-dependent Fis family transcriptional regulator, partial [bacterium]|nr:sigma-54-dependent Fis family transcriptional regulator [bacterium]
QEGPLPGYDIKVARNLAKELIEKADSSLSLSAVREAMQSGSSVLTDNALQDERFEAAESVHSLELKSILVLPLKGTQGVIGALYLDHRYQTNLFKPGDLVALQAFADQAALALQKAQMIEELKRANDRLSQTVDVQASELSVLKREVEDQRQKLTFEYKDIVGSSPAMLEVLSLVDRITDTGVPVWIYGESGTGKEMIARALHFNSSRAKKPFVSENCSALPETLLESELFGHKRGAFTHADRDKKGLLEYAKGGTVFLDEIADMSPTMQAKLLRFLQEGEIRPLGSNEIIKVDVRVVSASNKDLLALIGEGKFREDLYYRLNGVTVTLPPLRERLEDIPILARHFLKKFAKDENQTPLEITPDALELIMAHPWPGNVRELENTLRTAALFHQKHKLTPKSFNFKKVFFEEGPAAPTPASAGTSRKASGAGSNLTDEKRILLKALYDQGYHKGLAAETLGISRRYLYTQMMRHGVPINRIEMKSYVETQLGIK